MPDGIKITLLSAEDISSGTRLDVLEKVGVLCNQSELVAITKGQVSPENDRTIQSYSSEFFTKTVEPRIHYITAYDNANTRIVLNNCNKPSFAIRPVLELPDEMFYEVIQNKRKYYPYSSYCVELGHYIQTPVQKELHKELTKLLKAKKLKKVNGGYTLDVSPYISKTMNFQKQEVYEYEGKKYSYVRVCYPADEKDVRRYRRVLSNGISYKEGDYAWVEVEPLNWLIDDKTKKLICEKTLLAGIPYSKNVKFYNNFEESFVYSYLRDYMLPEIFQFTYKLDKNANLDEVEETSDSLDENDLEIKKIVEEINGYSKYYFGDHDIASIVEKKVSQYNNDVLRLYKQEEENDTALKVDQQDVNRLYMDLKSDLETLLDRLRASSIKTKPYFDMIEILSGEMKDEIADFISSIRAVINGSVILEKSRDALLQDLNSVINVNIERCKSFLEAYKQNEHIYGKSLEELKLDFRSDLQPFLEKLHETAIKRDIVHEILEGTQDIINDQYKETKNVLAKYLLDLIKEVVNTINREGNEKDLEELKSRVSLEVDYDKDMSELFKELNERFKNAYQIELDIKARKTRIKRYNVSLVNLNVGEIFTRRKQQ